MSAPGFESAVRAPARTALAMLAALGCVLAAPAAAVPPVVNVHVPIVAALPGATVTIPLDMDQSLAPLGVLSIEYTMNIDPAFVSSVTLLTDGVVWTWGPPFTNVTPTRVYLAAAGATEIASGSTRLHSLQFHVSPTAPLGGTMPITFTKLRMNEGNPNAIPSLGLLHIGTSVDAPDVAGEESLALAPASPNPIRTGATFRYRIPASRGAGAARLAFFGVDGRRVRSFALGASGAGERSVFWDARDEGGRMVPAGVYIARLDSDAGRVLRRCIVVR